MDIKELAERALSFFEQDRRNPVRPGDEGKLFWHLKDRYPVWVYEMVHEAHGDMMPDDFKYSTVVEVLDKISEGQDPEELDLEPDVYTRDLYEWLSSNLERAGYVDEAVSELGHADERSSHGAGVVGDIALGQWYEMDEVRRFVVEALRKRLEAIEDGEPERLEKGGKEFRPDPKDWNPRGRS